MNRDRDMVDSALGSLRSVQYDGPSYDPQLEERLMKEFDQTTVSRRFAHRPAMAAALGILVLGGGAFAAGGGIQYIKSLFVTVEIDGQQVDVELQPQADGSHEGELTTTLADGRDAHVQVRKTENADAGEHEMRVEVNLDDGDQKTQDVNVSKRRVNVGGPTNGTIEDLGDAEPVHEWTSAQGVDRALYLITDEAGENLNVFTTTTDEAGAIAVKRLATLPAERFEGTPEVSVDDNGLISIKWSSGEAGNENVRQIKLMDVASDNPATMHVELKAALDQAMEDSPVKVKVHPEDAE